MDLVIAIGKAFDHISGFPSVVCGDINFTGDFLSITFDGHASTLLSAASISKVKGSNLFRSTKKTYSFKYSFIQGLMKAAKRNRIIYPGLRFMLPGQ